MRLARVWRRSRAVADRGRPRRVPYLTYRHTQSVPVSSCLRSLRGSLIVENVVKAVSADGTPGFVLSGGTARLVELKELADVNDRRTLEDATEFDIDLDSDALDGGTDSDDDDQDDSDGALPQVGQSTRPALGKSSYSGRTRYAPSKLA